jgi:hypothetical protein
MATEQEPIEDTELDDGEEDSAPEPLEVPDNPNEPVEVVTDEARKESRKAKRAERQSQFRAAQEEASRLRAEVEQLRRQPVQQAAPAQQAPNPAVQRLHQIDDATRRLHAEFRARAPKEDSEEYRDFERRNNELTTARMAAVVDAKTGQQQQPNVQELARAVAWQNFQSEHHDVFNHPQAQTWAWGEYYKRKAEGKPDTPETARQLLDDARRRFGLTPRGGVPAPDQATRQRFTGVGARQAGGAPSPGAIKMDAHDKRMARIAFMKEGVTEAQAYQKWANTAGKEREKMNRGKGG